MHTSGHTPAVDVTEWEWLVIFYLIDVFHVFYKVICAPPPISLVLHLKSSWIVSWRRAWVHRYKFFVAKNSEWSYFLLGKMLSCTCFCFWLRVSTPHMAHHACGHANKRTVIRSHFPEILTHAHIVCTWPFFALDSWLSTLTVDRYLSPPVSAHHCHSMCCKTEWSPS